MRFVKDGPEIPDQLVQTHEEGKVVFFCGAGISYPAGLPGFDGLVNRLFEALGEIPNAVEQTAIKDDRFDLAIDLLERRIGNRTLVREKLREILTPQDLSKLEATATHRALLMLAKARNGQTRLVTTNFDRIFYAVDSKLSSFAAPLLPVPKKSRWDGLVYLHGLLPEGDDANGLNNLVVSSGDFGRAYLTERWASRFVTDLFRGYAVCFVGYSVSDPVLRYMLDALSADRMMGEITQEVFAFGSFKSGHEIGSKQDWQAKGVTPILYPETKNHDLLHGTLQEWADIYRDGLTGKRAIIVREAAALPSPMQGDGQMGRVLWAIIDPSGEPAKTFAQLDPVPPVEWLAVFTEPRYTQADLPKFGMPALPSGKSSKTFSLLNRPCSHEMGTWMALAGPANTIQGAEQLDQVMIWIACWIVHHLDKPEVLRWVLTNGGSLHPQVCYLISDRLKTDSIPRPLVTIWRIICAGLATSGHVAINFHNWTELLKKLGWSASLRAQLRDMLRPRVRFREPFRWKMQDSAEEGSAGRTARQHRFKDYAEWDISLGIGEHPKYRLDEVKKTPYWPQAAVDSLSDFTVLLRDAMDLMAELDGASEWSDISYLHRPSVSDHPQNHDFHEWTILIELCRDAWLLTADRNPRLARTELERWKLIRYPVFRRLILFAAVNSPLVSVDEGLGLLHDDEAWWMWASETRREFFRLLAWLPPKVDETQLAELCKIILAGPPRRMYRDDLNDKEWTELVDHAVWLRLEKLKKGGVVLPSETEERLRRISIEHLEWQLQPEDRDEFSTWMEVGSRGTWRKQVALPQEARQLADALIIRPSEDAWYEDDWKQICQTDPERAKAALTLLASEDKWPVAVWREALQVFSGETLLEHTWPWLSQCLQSAPSEMFRELLHTLGWWLRALAKVVPETTRGTWLLLLDRVFECTPAEEITAGGNPVSRAINHPIGHITEALIYWWYQSEPKAGAGLAEPVKTRLTHIADPEKITFIHGRVIMAAHLRSLYLADSDWATQTLLPYFDWNSTLNEAHAVWSGYLWSPRIHAELLDAFKTSFLTSARHYNDLGEHGEQYASLLTSASLELRDHFTTDELREAFNALPVDGLAEAAGMLARTLAAADNQREEYWSHRVKPLITEVWPKSADRRSEHESVALAEVCLRTGSLFPESLKMLKPWLRRTTHFYLPVKELAESDLVNRYPLESLQLLDALVDEGERWPSEEFQACLEKIGTADSRLQSTREYRRLKEYYDRFGRH